MQKKKISKRIKVTEPKEVVLYSGPADELVVAKVEVSASAKFGDDCVLFVEGTETRFEVIYLGEL